MRKDWHIPWWTAPRWWHGLSSLRTVSKPQSHFWALSRGFAFGFRRPSVGRKVVGRIYDAPISADDRPFASLGLSLGLSSNFLGLLGRLISRSLLIDTARAGADFGIEGLIGIGRKRHAGWTSLFGLRADRFPDRCSRIRAQGTWFDNRCRSVMAFSSLPIIGYIKGLRICPWRSLPGRCMRSLL